MAQDGLEKAQGALGRGSEKMCVVASCLPHSSAKLTLFAGGVCLHRRNSLLFGEMQVTSMSSSGASGAAPLELLPFASAYQSKSGSRPDSQSNSPLSCGGGEMEGVDNSNST